MKSPLRRAWPVIRSASYVAERRALKRRLWLGRSRGAVLRAFDAACDQEQRETWLIGAKIFVECDYRAARFPRFCRRARRFVQKKHTG